MAIRMPLNFYPPESKKKEQRETISLRLPSGLIERLNNYCNGKTFNRTDLIEELIIEFLEGQK